MQGRHRVLLVDHGGSCAHQRGADGRVGLLREHRDVAHGDLSGRGARHQQHRRGAPVALDAEIGRTVALPSGDVELLVVALADFDAEARGRVESHI